MQTIELNCIDPCLECTRRREPHVERILSARIMTEGVQDPLIVTVSDFEEGVFVLLDGFKRYRSARQSGLHTVPVEVIGQDTVDGVVKLLHRDRHGGLNTIEQAILVEYLHRKYTMGVRQIARRLGYPTTWVSVRLDLLRTMSDVVRSKLMTDSFPVGAYMYGVTNFARANNCRPEEVDSFVETVSGQGLSSRDVFGLADAYFGGTASIKELVTNGKPLRALQLLKGDAVDFSDPDLSIPQCGMVNGLRAVAVFMQSVPFLLRDITWREIDFSQSVNFWTEIIGKHWEDFSKTLGELYDRSRPTGGRPLRRSRGVASGWY